MYISQKELHIICTVYCLYVCLHVCVGVCVCDWTDWREHKTKGEHDDKKTLLDIYTGREGRSAIISNQDVIDILLDFSLSLSTPPGSCHSRTLKLVSSRHRQLCIIISLSYVHMHTFLFWSTVTHKLSRCVFLVIGSETKHTQMFFALICSPVTIGGLSAATTNIGSFCFCVSIQDRVSINFTSNLLYKNLPKIIFQQRFKLY